MNLPETMTILVWEAPRLMALRQRPLPPLQPDEVLIQVWRAGICGSELSGYLGHNALRIPPLVMGHEFSGEVVQLGEGVPHLNPAIHIGTQVTANPLVYCGSCEYCQAGLNQLCVNRRLLGAHRPGAFAQYISVPVQQIVPLPVEVSLPLGALAEPLACAVRITELTGAAQGEQVLVMGAGAIGLMTLKTLLMSEVQCVFVADTNPERLAVAEAWGGTTINPRKDEVVKTVRQATAGRGVWAAIDAVGTAETRAQCIAATRTTGTVVISGLHEESSSIPAADIIRREIVLRGHFAYSPANFRTAVDLLGQGQIQLGPWIVEAPLSDGGSWFERLVEGAGGLVKVLLVP